MAAPADWYKMMLPRAAALGSSSRRDVAQPGRALAWGARGRQFKSARPDHSTSYILLHAFPPNFDYSPGGTVPDKLSQFIRERQYLQPVSTATVEWYTHAFR